MIKALVLLVVTSTFAVLTHRQKTLEKKHFKQVPIVDWFIILIIPILLYIAWVAIVKNIVERPFVQIIKFSDFDIIALTIPFIAYGSIGNAIHFVSKALWRHLSKLKEIHATARAINEMFHGKVSHYLIFTNAIMIMFLLPILELNHPADQEFSKRYFFAIISLGALFGYLIKKMFWYTNDWFGGFHRPLFGFIGLLLAILWFIYNHYRLEINDYPVWILILSVLITIEGIFIVNKVLYLLGLSKPSYTDKFQASLKYIKKYFT